MFPYVLVDQRSVNVINRRDRLHRKPFAVFSDRDSILFADCLRRPAPLRRGSNMAVMLGSDQ